MPVEQLSRTEQGPQAGWVVVDPRYHRHFARWGLADARAFLDLPGEVVSGHPDRHVVRVVLGHGRHQLAAYLKREHRVPWRDRLANAWAGFGWVSKSEREARLLGQLRQARIPVPRCLAFGEDGEGRAFALVRAVPAALDLRTYLHRARRSRPCGRQPRRLALARRLGRLLARVHATGFDCPDLSSKHVLVRLPKLTPTLIDWPRARRRSTVPLNNRVRDLAALHASLADELASPRERLASVRAYLTALNPGQAIDRRDLKQLVMAVQRRATRLLGRRSVRELRRAPVSTATQRLRWINGEALCVVRGFWRRCQGQAPSWLTTAARDAVTQEREESLIYEGRTLLLRQSPPASRVRRALAWLRGRRVTSPGLRQAGRVFRLERFGVAAPRLLAFGQRADAAGFVLLQPRTDTVPLAHWLGTVHHERLDLLRAVGTMIRRIHDAGYRLTDTTVLRVRCRRFALSPVLADVAALQECRHGTGERELLNVLQLLRLSGEDEAAFVGAYRVGCAETKSCPNPVPLNPSALPAHVGGPAPHA